MPGANLQVKPATPESFISAAPSSSISRSATTSEGNHMEWPLVGRSGEYRWKSASMRPEQHVFVPIDPVGRCGSDGFENVCSAFEDVTLVFLQFASTFSLANYAQWN